MLRLCESLERGYERTARADVLVLDRLLKLPYSGLRRKVPNLLPVENRSMRDVKPVELTEAQMSEVNGGNCVVISGFGAGPCSGSGWNWADGISQYFWGTVEVFFSPF
jgi:hypothetical protein